MDLAQLAFALFSGAGIVIAWEGVMKPWIDRERAVRLVAAEVALNLGDLYYLRECWKRDASVYPPVDLKLSRLAFAQILLLPGNLVHEAVRLYSNFEYISREVEEWIRTIERTGWRTADNEVAAAEGYVDAIGRAIFRAEQLLPRLLKQGWPLFSRPVALTLVNLRADALEAAHRSPPTGLDRVATFLDRTPAIEPTLRRIKLPR
jgi:hypothetical protein